MYIKNIIIVLGLSFIVAGCATIASGTTQQVTFQSTPDGSLVKLDGNPLGNTPLTLQLDKKAGQTLTFEKEGYKTYSTPMTTETDGWFWGNILLGGLLGTTTDSMSGAIHEYAPGEYIVTLEPDSSAKLELDSELSEKEKARRFLFVNYGKLQADLSKNSGETLDSALFLLKITIDNKSVAIAEMKKAMFSQQSPAKFISLVVDKYLG